MDLKTLTRDYNLKALRVEQAWNEFIRDAFINWILSHQIRQMLPENKTLDLTTGYFIRHCPEIICISHANWNCQIYTNPMYFYCRTPIGLDISICLDYFVSLFKQNLLFLYPLLKTFLLFTIPRPFSFEQPVTAALAQHKCYFCRLNSPAWKSICHKCKTINV